MFLGIAVTVAVVLVVGAVLYAFTRPGRQSRKEDRRFARDFADAARPDVRPAPRPPFSSIRGDTTRRRTKSNDALYGAEPIPFPPIEPAIYEPPAEPAPAYDHSNHSSSYGDHGSSYDSSSSSDSSSSYDGGSSDGGGSSGSFD